MLYAVEMTATLTSMDYGRPGVTPVHFRADMFVWEWIPRNPGHFVAATDEGN